MSWKDRLRAKTVTAEEALAAVRSGTRVFIQGAVATPHVLVQALVDRAEELTDVEIVHLHTNGPAPYVAPDMAGHFRHRALFIGPNVREAVNAGRADYVPVFLSDIPALFTSGTLPIDVALLNVSRPDDHGYCSYGTSVDVAKAAAETAKVVIAQVNDRMPRTLGDSFIHVDRLTFAVPVSAAPLLLEAETGGTVEARIGSFIAELVEDGATLQMGIGAIPNAALAALTTKRDLGIHTEMFSDGVVDLVERGVVNGERKTLRRGKIVSSFVMGTERLYRFVDDNPMVEMHPIEYTNDTAVIRRNDRMTAINSAIQIDLTGQVVADSIGSRFYSGVGGQMDFMRGAALARDGKAIIALPSTARGGTISRIVPVLDPGAGVVTTRAHLHYVVTEYGVAYLHGKSIRERAHALIGLADPAFRADLTTFARKHNYI